MKTITVRYFIVTQKWFDIEITTAALDLTNASVAFQNYRLILPNERAGHVIRWLFLTYNVCFILKGDTVYATVVPEVDERELEKTVNPIVREYFEHGDTKEVQVSV